MGNFISRNFFYYNRIIDNPNNNETINNDECFICWEKIDNPRLVKCVRCKIKMHNNCENKYRCNKDYCKCPHCQRYGSLGIIIRQDFELHK